MQDGDPFFKKFLVMEIADVRKELATPDVLSAACVNMSKALNGPITTTEKLVKTIRSVIRARLTVLRAEPPTKKAKTAAAAKKQPRQ